jgi:hypothetical protein
VSFAAAGVLLLLCLAGSRPAAAGAADAPPPAGEEAIAEVTPEEELCLALLESFERAIAAREGEDEILALEAGEIASVAEEILTEGDPETASVLLEEALALLSPDPEE